VPTVPARAVSIIWKITYRWKGEKYENQRDYDEKCGGSSPG
jgi:hypothetical protein